MWDLVYWYMYTQKKCKQQEAFNSSPPPPATSALIIRIRLVSDFEIGAWWGMLLTLFFCVQDTKSHSSKQTDHLPNALFVNMRLEEPRVAVELHQVVNLPLNYKIAFWSNKFHNSRKGLWNFRLGKSSVSEKKDDNDANLSCKEH